jgi:hypothetical protein
LLWFLVANNLVTLPRTIVVKYKCGGKEEV